MHYGMVEERPWSDECVWFSPQPQCPGCSVKKKKTDSVIHIYLSGRAVKPELSLVKVDEAQMEQCVSPCACPTLHPALHPAI